MLDKSVNIGKSVLISKLELNSLLQELRKNGYQTVGPCPQDGSILYKTVNTLDDFPVGLDSSQSPARYRLTQVGNGRIFDFIPAADSWKKFLFPPRTTLLTGEKNGDWVFKPIENKPLKFAFVGVRACELAAILIQDKIFLRSDFSDPIYRVRREGLFIIAVNCLKPDATCFCSSMGTGPRVGPGYDLCLTEMDDTFLVDIGSELGRSFLATLKWSLPSAYIQNAVAQALSNAASSITRFMDTNDLPAILSRSLESNLWDQVAKRCLSCTSCTMVCPTCFCWDVEDRTNIPFTQTKRDRVWDSCFNPNYSYVFGGNTRPNIRSRYRQWLTHKLGTWKDQFGMLGCVGCGRCITWCPAGIDITEEVRELRREVES